MWSDTVTSMTCKSLTMVSWKCGTSESICDQGDDLADVTITIRTRKTIQLRNNTELFQEVPIVENANVEVGIQ